MRNAILRAAAIFLATAFASTAAAAPLKWTLHGVTFDDGATASGSFAYDADTNEYSAVEINVTPAFESWWSSRYSDVCASCAVEPASADAVALLSKTASSNLAGAQVLLLTFNAALTGSGGTTTLGASTESYCADSTCTSLGEFDRSVSAGSVQALVPVITPAAVPVPALSPIPLLMLTAMLVLVACRAFAHSWRRDRSSY